MAKEQDDLAKATRRLENEAKALREKGKKLQEVAAAYLDRAEKLERMLGEL